MISILFFLLSIVAAGQGVVYEFEDGGSPFRTKNYFYDNGEEVIAFDAQLSMATARKSIEYLRSKTKSPVTWLVVLHPGIDRYNGLNAFKEIGAKVVMSRETSVEISKTSEYWRYFFNEGTGRSYSIPKENWLRLADADSLFEMSMNIELRNGQLIVLKDLSGQGMHSNHTIAYIADDEIVFAGDLIQYQIHPFMDGNVSEEKVIPTLDSWIKSLNELNKLFKRDPDITVYGGRGKSTSLPTAIWEQSRYLKAAYPIIVNYYNGNRREWSGTNVPSKFRREFEQQMNIAFPGIESPEIAVTALWLCWECPDAEKVR